MSTPHLSNKKYNFADSGKYRRATLTSRDACRKGGAKKNPEYLQVFLNAPASEFLEIKKLEDECSYTWKNIFDDTAFSQHCVIPAGIPPAQKISVDTIKFKFSDVAAIKHRLH